MTQNFDFLNADPMFVEVARSVVAAGRASVRALQYDFNFGFNRASNLLAQLEAAGIVSGPMGCRPRAVLCTAEELEQRVAEWQK